MIYKFVLELELGQSTVNLTDRHNNILPVEIQQHNVITTISTDIELPNKIKVHIQNASSESEIKLVGASLGHIKFNKHNLSKLFVYHHPYGLNRDTTWKFGSLVEFEFFEHSAIKYHLLIGTTI